MGVSLGVCPPLLLSADISFSAKAFLLTSIFAIFGQDWCYLLGLSDGQLIFQPEFWKSNPVLWTFFPVPQAWVLGVEVTFYVLAPLLLLKRKVLLIAFGFAASLKIWALLHFGGADPWIYRVFPLELSLFLFGAIIQQYFCKVYQRVILVSKRVGVDLLIFIVTVSAVLFYRSFAESIWFLRAPNVWEGLAGIVALAFVFPALASFQNRYRFDRLVGNLSYPIYISHWLMITVGGYLLGQYGITHQQISSAFITLLSVAAAVILYILVAWPVEHFRKKIRSGSSSNR